MKEAIHWNYRCGILLQHNLEENEMKEGWKINKTRIWFLVLKNVLQWKYCPLWDHCILSSAENVLAIRGEGDTKHLIGVLEYGNSLLIRKVPKVNLVVFRCGCENGTSRIKAIVKTVLVWPFHGPPTCIHVDESQICMVGSYVSPAETSCFPSGIHTSEILYAPSSENLTQYKCSLKLLREFSFWLAQNLVHKYLFLDMFEPWVKFYTFRC
jgi:hypothetical protein